MSNSITCVCGYRGPSVTEGSRSVCPICRTPAAGVFAPAVPTPPPAAAAKPLPDPEDDPAQAKARPHYRIPCPRGHVLKAPATMLGQQVFCPQCNEVFVLRETDSLEHKRHQQILDREREAQQAQVWLQRAIMAAVFVALSFAVMVAIQFMR
jgi:hypothetical protein